MKIAMAGTGYMRLSNAMLLANNKGAPCTQIVAIIKVNARREYFV